MGNIGTTELLVIFVLALLLLGPKKLPEIGDALGRTLRRFRQASRELRDELDVRRDLDVRNDIDAEDTPRVQPALEARPRETNIPAEPPPAAPATAGRDPAASGPEADPDRNAG